MALRTLEFTGNVDLFVLNLQEAASFFFPIIVITHIYAGMNCHFHENSVARGFFSLNVGIEHLSNKRIVLS